MSKYPTGYALISMFSVIGVFLIGASLIGGAIIYFEADRGMGWVGFAVAISGTLQGLMLMGIAAIGEAILDSSSALEKISVNISKSLLNKSKVYKGLNIFIGPYGFLIGGIDGVFKDESEAERRIDEAEAERRIDEIDRVDETIR